MKDQETIIRALRLIEEKAYDRLTVHELSAKLFISGSYLQKLFKLVTGQALMDYVRGRKLAHSLEPLLHSGKRIIDIAYDFGFEHEQSYIRAFCTEFGCTPGKARKSQLFLPVRERILPENLHSLAGGLLEGPRIVVTPQFYVVGKPHLLCNYNHARDGSLPNRFANEFIMQDLKRISNTVSDEVYFGICTFPTEAGPHMEYMPSVQVKDLSVVPQGLRGQAIPAGLCLCYRYVGEGRCEDIGAEAVDEARGLVYRFLSGQTRYVRCDNMRFEKIDRHLYDGLHCQMEWMIYIEDTQKG